MLAVLPQRSCPGCPVPTLSLLSCSGYQLFSVLSRLTWSGLPFQPTCPDWPVPVVLTKLSFPGCQALAVLPMAAPSRLSCLSCPALSNIKVGNLWNFCISIFVRIYCLRGNFRFREHFHEKLPKFFAKFLRFRENWKRHFRFNPNYNVWKCLQKLQKCQKTSKGAIKH